MGCCGTELATQKRNGCIHSPFTTHVFHCLTFSKTAVKKNISFVCVWRLSENMEKQKSIRNPHIPVIPVSIIKNNLTLKKKKKNNLTLKTHTHNYPSCLFLFLEYFKASLISFYPEILQHVSLITKYKKNLTVQATVSYYEASFYVLDFFRKVKGNLAFSVFIRLFLFTGIISSQHTRKVEYLLSLRLPLPYIPL